MRRDRRDDQLLPDMRYTSVQQLRPQVDAADRQRIRRCAEGQAPRLSWCLLFVRGAVNGWRGDDRTTKAERLIAQPLQGVFMPVPLRVPAVQLTAISPQPPADVKCPRRRYYLINPSEKKQLDAGCSRWDCHFCARYKRRRLRKRLEQVRWRLMLTLTLSADCDLATQSAALGRFIRIARRE